MIDVQGLQKIFPGTRAVDDLSFRVEPGQILGLLGPNGAGKTTTLRCLSGVIPSTSGEVAIGGHLLSRDPIEAKRLLAYIPDDPKLFDNLTCWEHLQFIATTYKVRAFKPQAEAYLERFELTEKRDALGSELSRGMRQKLATVCALIHSPQAILFDEPMTGLDPRAIRTLYEVIGEQAAAGAAVMISSHLLSMVERLCTHILVLHEGRAVAQGSIEAVRESFPELSGEATLEEVFFRATANKQATPAPDTGGTPPEEIREPR